MFVCTFTYMYIWVHTGEVGAKRLRERYFQAVLRQDIAFFDKVGAGEVATRIQTDTREFPFDIYIPKRKQNRSHWFLQTLSNKAPQRKWQSVPLIYQPSLLVSF